MDALSLSFRRSSAPELNNFLPRRPTLERKLTSPAVLETSETRLRSHSHQFEKCIGLQLPDIVMTKQPRIPKGARIGDITRSCKDDELVKLDIVVSKKRLCEGANLSNGAIRKTKLSRFSKSIQSDRWSVHSSPVSIIQQLSAKIKGNSTVYWKFRKKL